MRNFSGQNFIYWFNLCTGLPIKIKNDAVHQIILWGKTPNNLATATFYKKYFVFFSFN